MTSNAIRERLQRFAADRRGAAFTEYLIIVGIVALLGITIFNGFRNQIQTAVTGQGASVAKLGNTP